MKKVPVILLLAAPYVFLFAVIIICIAEEGLTARMMEMSSYLFLGMLIVVFIPNMIYAFILPRKGWEQRQMFFWNMILKICNVPIYILVFVFGLLMCITIFGLMLLPFLFIFDFLLLLSSSMYGISGLRLAGKEGTWPKTVIVINGICQFVFVADLASAVYLYLRSRKDSVSVHGC